MSRITIAIVNMKISPAGMTPLRNLISIFKGLKAKVIIIDRPNSLSDEDMRDDQVTWIRNRLSEKMETISILTNFACELNSSIKILLMNRYVDCWVFFIGGELFPISLTIARLIGKSVVLILPGSAKMSVLDRHSMIIRAIELQSKISKIVAPAIVVYSPKIIEDYHLNNYEDKIIIANEHFIDTGIFRIIKPFEKRDNLIGFIGRFSIEKGVMNLVQAAKMNWPSEFKLVLIGDGILRDRIEEFVEANGLKDRISIISWLDRGDIPKQLNELRLLIIPSYSEGLPNVMIESMSCGTPVVANAVGAIPDVITDGVNGFLIKDNNPETISCSISEAIKSDLDAISKRGSEFVRQNFQFENPLRQWKDVFDKLGLLHD